MAIAKIHENEVNLPIDIRIILLLIIGSNFIASIVFWILFDSDFSIRGRSVKRIYEKIEELEKKIDELGYSTGNQETGSKSPPPQNEPQ